MSNPEANAVVGQRLKKIRKALRLKQKEMAKVLGIAPSSFSEIETGITGINTDLYQALSEKFNINIEYLVNGRGEMFYTSEPGKTAPGKDDTEYVFDSDIDSIEKLVFMMRKSTYFRLSILQSASEFFMNKEDLIRKNMDTTPPKHS